MQYPVLTVSSRRPTRDSHDANKEESYFTWKACDGAEVVEVDAQHGP